MFCRGFGGIRRRADDRYEPPETARWLTKQSNEQSNRRRTVRDSVPERQPGKPAFDEVHTKARSDQTLPLESEL